MTAFQSRWGWHPCSYEHFRLLKDLHRLLWESIRLDHASKRYYRKAPQNRVKVTYRRDGNGRKIGLASRIWMPAPKSPDGEILMLREAIIADLLAARMPCASPDAVPKLRLSIEAIHRLLKIAKAA